MYTYLLINVFSILIPFIASFDKRLDFVGKWKYFFPAMFLTMAFFIAWDVLFTHWGIWGFNPRYLTGIEVINLPLEEWLFFFTIPYACVFTYEALNYLVKKDYFGPASGIITHVLIAGLIILAVVNYHRMYTMVTFSLTAIFLALHFYVFNSRYLGRFYFSYLIVLIPFFIVNGILTGSFIEEEVVWYNNAENLSIRMFTIPVEDSVYGLLLILMNVTIYERLKGRGERTIDNRQLASGRFSG
ncbi:MAG: lycopene cyclase domain-containing protein [Bacteroidales bacterium]|nr:lycopene cyclase domain-containing protein [Bacteroidales bacterium]